MTGWSDVVTTALLGTDRREIPTDLPEDLASFARRVDTADPAGRLLDIAAGYTVYCRAGAARDSCPPSVQPPAAGPVPAPGEAQRVLRGLVELRAARLVTEWLRLCVDHGWSVAPALWAALADLATSSPGVDPELLRLALGRRGMWFLAHNDHWLRLCTAGSPAAQDGGGNEQPEESPSRLSGAGDPEAVRAEVDRAWGRARADAKVALLRSLEPEIAADDEARLLRGLRDRSAEVRGTAARLMSRMPESSYSRRMAERATEAVTFTRALGRRRVVVEAPQLDETMTGDGISDRPPQSFRGGPGAYVLRQVLAATPLTVWPSTTGLQPSELLDVAARTNPDWLADLRAGWAEAARRQGDAAWAEALLAAGEVEEGLVGLVPADARVGLAVRWTHQDTDPGRIAELVLACPRPWPAELAESALRVLSSGRLGSMSRRFADEAGYAMSLDCYPVLERHVLGWVPRKGMTPHEAAEVRAGHARVEELLATRIAVHEGFNDLPTTIRRFAVPHLR